MKKIKQNLVSIGLMVYNGEKTLNRVLESVHKQTYKDFELLISDDCSADSSSKICQEFCKKDKRFKYIRQAKNLGLKENFRYILDNTNTQYITWLGQDDYYEDNNYIESLYNEISKGYDLVFANIKKIINNNNKSRILKLNKFTQKDWTNDKYKNHLNLLKKSYLGYQIIYGLSDRKIHKNIDIWLKNTYYGNLPDEEPYLHFILCRYKINYIYNVSYIKDMGESYYSKMNTIKIISPLFWHTISCIGAFSQSQYTNKQKIILSFFKIARSSYLIFDNLVKDINKLFSK